MVHVYGATGCVSLYVANFSVLYCVGRSNAELSDRCSRPLCCCFEAYAISFTPHCLCLSGELLLL